MRNHKRGHLKNKRSFCIIFAIINKLWRQVAKSLNMCILSDVFVVVWIKPVVWATKKKLAKDSENLKKQHNRRSIIQSSVYETQLPVTERQQPHRRYGSKRRLTLVCTGRLREDKGSAFDGSAQNTDWLPKTSGHFGERKRYCQIQCFGRLYCFKKEKVRPVFLYCDKSFSVSFPENKK